MAREERFGWRDAVICGLLWGGVVVLATSLTQPVGGLQLGDLARWIFSLSIIWMTTGVIWAVGAKLAEESQRPILTAPLVLMVAWIVSMAVTGTPVSVGGNLAPGDFGRTAHIPLFDLSVYTLWINLFYGGLYTLGYFATRRALGLRRRLAKLGLARSEAEAALREMRLEAVRGQIQPAMLLEALGALRETYGRDQAAGERLFDLLIAFLRAAMPGLRSGASTLSTELAVVDCYAALREALGAGAPSWRLSLHPAPPDLLFPPLRLLPALDRMSRAMPSGAAVDVRATPVANGFLLQVAAHSPQPLSPKVLNRLRAGMRRDLGLSAMMGADLTGALVAELRLGAKPSEPTDIIRYIEEKATL